jgi:biopolymer transport protein ExbB/TolQ
MSPDAQPSAVADFKQVLGFTERVMGRTAALVHLDLSNGLNTLATIACLAPFVGMLGTVRAIMMDTFRGLGTEKYTALAIQAKELSLSCVPMAVGLLVGLQSL